MMFRRLSARPVTARAFSRLFGTDLRSEAVQKVELSPATVRETRPAVSLPGELDRVLRHFPEAKFNLSRMLDERVYHDATTAYLIRDVIIADDTLLRHRSCEVVKPGGRRWLLRDKPENIPNGMFCTDHVVETYFGHWMVDGLARELLAADRGLLPIALDRPSRYHEAGYRQLTGLQAYPVSLARVERLWILDDSGLNDGRMRRIDRVRERLRAAVPTGGPARVFVARGDQGAGRSLINEREVINALVQRGFAILTPEREDAATIARTLRSASIIVSVEGSAIAHAAMVVPKGAALLVIQPPNQFNTIWKSIADGLGLRFGYTVGVPDEGNAFSQPIDRLIGTLDLLEMASA